MVRLDIATAIAVIAALITSAVITPAEANEYEADECEILVAQQTIETCIKEVKE